MLITEMSKVSYTTNINNETQIKNKDHSEHDIMF